MPTLKLTLLGPFQATLDGNPLRSLASTTARALLAYLAVEAEPPHPREILAALLWPELPDRVAMTHLRHTLSHLRRALAHDDPHLPFLLASRETIQLNPSAPCDLDVSSFTHALSSSTPHRLPLDLQTLTRLEQAVALYRGCFLDGLAVKSAPFEEWALLKREQLHWQAMDTLHLLTAAYLARADYNQAQRFARRQLELQPWLEEAHRQLMRSLALDGQRSAALAQFQICVQRLADELGVAPADDTLALYLAIRDGKLTDPDALKPEDSLTSANLPPTPLPTSSPSVFVSREPELAHLDHFLQATLAGQGRVAFVCGQAGTGKTALLAHFARRAMARLPDLVAVGGACNAYAGSGDPYLPFREILQLLSGDIEPHRAGGSLTPEHARRLWSLLPSTAQALLAFGPDLLGTFVPTEPLLRRTQAFAPDAAAWWNGLESLAHRPPTADGPLPSQSDLFDQITQVLLAIAAHHPLILTLDDLQWADKGSLALLFHLARRLRHTRILLLGAYRSASVALRRPLSGRSGPWERHPLEPLLHEFSRDWGDIQVDLDHADGRAFVDAFLDTEPNHLGPAFRNTLYHHTAGNPLFTIELLRGLQERGDLLLDPAGRWVEGPTLHWDRLPARVEAVIAERFDRLPPDCQHLLQIASVEGEEFTAEVLARVASLSPPRVIRCLSETLSKQHRLVHAARLLRREPSGRPLSCYRFAHYLVQRYVYDHLDDVARTHLHRSVALALESFRSNENTETQTAAQDPTAPVRLARHWEAAGRFDKAATYLLQAGRRAEQLSAYDEATQLLRWGLTLVEQLPNIPDRTQLEQQILTALVRSLMPTQGWGSPERARLAHRALHLARQLPASQTDLLGALYMDAEILTAHGKHSEALNLANLLLQLAQRTDNPAYMALGHHSLGNCYFFAGDMARSVPELQHALTLYDHPLHAHLLPWTDGDLAVRCLSMLAAALSYVGYADQALSHSQQAFTQALNLAHPLTEAVALTFAGCAFHALRSETQPVLKHAHRLLELADQKHLSMFRSHALIYQGWAQAMDGAGGPAIAQIRHALAEWQAMGHRAGNPFLVLLLAQALHHNGALDEALATVDDGLILTAEISPANRAEFCRLKGELLNLRLPPDPEQADACLRTALAEARQQGSRLLELRAATSLARHWAKSGRRADAHRTLAEIYAWFSEGFDTPDLRAAKALLDTLRDPGGH